MTYIIAPGNRENYEVVKKHNIWGVPKRSRSLHSRVQPGDTILMYIRSEVHRKDLLPSAIMGAYKIQELFEDETPIFTAPPQMGNEVFPHRFRLKVVCAFTEPVK